MSMDVVDHADELVRRFTRRMHQEFGAPVRRRRDGSAIALVSTEAGWVPITLRLPRTSAKAAVSLEWTLGIAPRGLEPGVLETEIDGESFQLRLSIDDHTAVIHAAVPTTWPVESLVELALAVAFVAEAFTGAP
jgi:hypothetical protein